MFCNIFLENFKHEGKYEKMKMQSLSCPNCGSDVDIENGLDTFFCKYCGHKIVLDGMSKEAYEARIKEKEIEFEKYKMEKDEESRSKALKLMVAILIVCMFLMFVTTKMM